MQIYIYNICVEQKRIASAIAFTARTQKRKKDVELSKRDERVGVQNK